MVGIAFEVVAHLGMVGIERGVIGEGEIHEAADLRLRVDVERLVGGAHPAVIVVDPLRSSDLADASPSPGTAEDHAYSTFGGGAHICAGMHLANMEIVITLQEWLARIPAFRLEQGFRMAAHSGVVADVETLSLEWGI